MEIYSQIERLDQWQLNMNHSFLWNLLHAAGRRYRPSCLVNRSSFKPSIYSSLSKRLYSSGSEQRKSQANRDMIIYLSSMVIVIGSCVYASVPLYRMFCQKTGYGGTPRNVSDQYFTDKEKPNTPQPVAGSRPVKIIFESETSPKLPWKFVPEQRSVLIKPGQTVLAFYSAENLGSRDIVGMATYNVVPAKAAQYFNKIQCFCFEEQQLSPKEKVDMPVFFYLDPEYAYDPLMDTVSEIVLGYTFFETNNSE